MNLDLIFVIKADGSYEATPLKKLRAQENYSDSFVVIANRGGIVKSNIKLLSRTDKVISQFLLPTLEKPADLIGDKSYFQEYANANVWRIAVDKKALHEISMSYSGQIEVSFTFTSLVDDSRATNFIGDLTLDLPLTASEGDYLVCKLSSFTKDDITWTYGQIAVWDNGWKKGGTYRVEGNTTTHKMSVEPTLVGQLPDFDEEKADEVFNSLETMTSEISNVREDLDDLEEAMGIAEADILGLQNRMNVAEQDIDKIEDGTTVVDKALKDDLGNTIKSTYANKLDLVYSISNNRIAITLKSYDGTPIDADLIDLPKATTSADGLLSATDKTRLDNLWSVLQNSDDPNFVDTINEILAIFANYPQGMDIIAQFATKVDKVAGKGLSTNDYTNEEKSKVANAASKAYVDEGDETIQAHDLDNATVERVMFVIENGQPILRIE